jgi:hypothetical protein
LSINIVLDKNIISRTVGRINKIHQKSPPTCESSFTHPNL